MVRRYQVSKNVFVLYGIILLLLLSSCAQNKIQLGTIPQPPATNKLRVLVYTLIETVGSSITDEEFTQRQYQKTVKVLAETGIYEVVPYEDVQTVLGKEYIQGWILERNDNLLARQAAKALYADYILFVERGGSYQLRLQYYAQLKLINVENGKQFRYWAPMSGNMDLSMWISSYTRLYRNIFIEAKEDMLANAIKKSHIMQRQGTLPAMPSTVVKAEEIAETPPAKKTTLSPPAIDKGIAREPLKQAPKEDIAAIKTPAPPLQSQHEVLPVKPVAPIITVRKPDMQPEDKLPQVTAATDKVKDFIREPVKPPAKWTVGDTKTKMVVYDFNSTLDLNVIARILTEALREELFKLGSYNLINRENISQIMDELRLQQSALVDDKNALKIGKWLAAQESVTGRLVLFGNNFILSVKRTDIESLGILGMASVKCLSGEEDNLLKGMPILAKKLTEPRGK